MAILQNVFVRAIIVPIVLACAAALLECIATLAKGRSKGQYKFRVWIEQKLDDGTTRPVPLHGQSIGAIHARDDIVDIEPMVNFDVANFASLGIDLVVGAFAVDIASLIQAQSDMTITGYVLIVQLFGHGSQMPEIGPPAP